MNTHTHTSRGSLLWGMAVTTELWISVMWRIVREVQNQLGLAYQVHCQTDILYTHTSAQAGNIGFPLKSLKCVCVCVCVEDHRETGSFCFCMFSLLIWKVPNCMNWPGKKKKKTFVNPFIF